MIMKTINKYMTVVLFAASVFCTVSCDDPQPIEPVTPVFPELVENLAVQAGDTLALTFTPNLDWELTVPKDTMDFFWLIDGGFQYDKISGKASEEAVTVYVGVGKADFENHTSTVKLTMGGETRIIASYMLPALEKSIKIQSCQVDEYGSWLFDENGGYLYTSEEPEVINLVYSGSDFRIPVKITSNFEYTIEFPTWARADIPEKTVGENEFSIYGVPSEYPLTETSDKIVIKSGSEVIAEYQIAIPGCSDILSYGVELVSSIKFNELGQYLTLVNFMEGPVNAWVTGVENVKVFAVEKVDGKYAVDGNAPAWLDITLSAYDNSDGADVLQQRSVQVSLKKYTSDSEALLFFLPPTGWDKVSDLFNEDATEVKENKREKWVAFVGLYEGYPYEIFTGLMDDEEGIMLPKSVSNGRIIKHTSRNGQKRYDFQFENKRGYKTTVEGLSEKFNPEYWNYAKLISGVLRYRMPIDHVIKLVSSLELDSDNINSWTTGVVRALKRYLPNAPLEEE